MQLPPVCLTWYSKRDALITSKNCQVISQSHVAGYSAASVEQLAVAACDSYPPDSEGGIIHSIQLEEKPRCLKEEMFDTGNSYYDALTREMLCNFTIVLLNDSVSHQIDKDYFRSTHNA